ncbi:MAG TPA: DUF4337 domain-containing protein [Patescibacteria group bacterium]|nr:DUF4337 domain-containing protein [Patescibacteria group bacterium]
MEVNEVAEQIAEFEKKEEKEDGYRRMVAVLISVLALLLAITALGSNRTSKELFTANIRASDTWNFYQAKTIRQTAFSLAADEAESLGSIPNLSPEAKTALAAKAQKYRDTATRYESEADGTGKKELMLKAREIEHQREEAEHREHYFGFAEAMLQIAIVLASAAVASGVRFLVGLSVGLGVFGLLLSINAFTLLVALPF